MWYQGNAIKSRPQNNHVAKDVMFILSLLVIAACAFAAMIITSPYL